MRKAKPIPWLALFLVVFSLAGSVWSLREVDRLRGQQATLEEVLYISSGKTLKRLSLGYSGLLADLYWTRAVQYFGAKLLDRRTQTPRYDLLYPLLDITTDLDPHLIVAYQDGSLFLSGTPPAGAGQPEKAVQLLEKGIRANPAYWRLYFSLGFVQYVDRKDYKAAQEAFEKGATVPGALPWMRVMAATMAQHADTPSTAIELWTRLYDSTDDKDLRQNAILHIRALRVDQDVAELEHRVAAFHEQSGQLPSNWGDLVRAGLLKGTPVDPNGVPYRLMPGGAVWVGDLDQLPFITKGLPPGAKPPKAHW
jgi:tetratricopeptide (TPR) repeat protein